jgi:alanyl-tRNA synthetase
MTEEIFRRDAYVSEFEAAVVSVSKEEVILDSTAFYPGGGGQGPDTGTIRGHRVTHTERRGGDIVHIVPGNDLKDGDRVWCSVDWDRRYDMMRGHTAEHLLFGALHRSCPDLGIVKISISPEMKYVIVDRDVDWKTVGDAVASVNLAIRKNLTVGRMVTSKDDPGLKNVRMDIGKLKGDEVTVVRIGDADAAACGGTHVMETGEIGAVLVHGKVSAGKDGFAIHFLTGWDAIDRAAELANNDLRISEILGSTADDSVKAMANLKEQADSSRRTVNAMVSSALKELKGEEVNGVAVHSGSFPAAEKKVFTDASDRFRASGGVSVLVSSDRSVTVFVASGSGKVDCSAVLKRTLERYGGRGGGTKEFAQGGIPDADDAESLLEDIVSDVRRALEN